MNGIPPVARKIVFRVMEQAMKLSSEPSIITLLPDPMWESLFFGLRIVNLPVGLLAGVIVPILWLSLRTTIYVLFKLLLFGFRCSPTLPLIPYLIILICYLGTKCLEPALTVQVQTIQASIDSTGNERAIVRTASKFED